MTNTLNVKHFLAVALLSSFNASSVVVAEEINDFAPEARATEIEMSFRDVPLLEAAFIDTSPADRNDGIVVGELHADGDDKDPLVQLAEEIADGQHDNFDSLLIAHKGKLLFESYYLKGRVDLPHPQASATKTYTAMALGRAIQLG
ncbi:MAG: hydrolase, partial [Pseudomonadota bacterium]